MTAGLPARHALVIATQCESERKLEGLQAAAEDLHEALTDPAIGGCTPQAGDSPSLLYGPSVSLTEIEQALRSAIDAARDEQAVLVLAFLGHGFVTGTGAAVYYMAAESNGNAPMQALNIGTWIGHASTGAAAVIALVDTCHAAAASIAVQEIAHGARAGRANVGILASARADQGAYGLDFTNSLTALLRQGMPGGREYVYIDDMLTDSLRAIITGQDVASIRLDTDAYATRNHWLSVNRAYSYRVADEVVGRIGLEDLQTSVKAWQPDRRLPPRVTEAALTDLRKAVAADISDDLSRMYVEDVLYAVDLCTGTERFLNRFLGSQLIDARIRAAARRARIPFDRAETGTALLRHLLEQATLREPKTNSNLREPLARLVAALVWECNALQQHEELTVWATQARLRAELNQAFTDFEQIADVAGLRLVISLDGALTGWPERIDAWLVDSSQDIPRQKSFDCASANRTAVEGAIKRARRWATSLLNGQTLRSVDVAAPAHILATWHPEETWIGVNRLKTHHDVTVRWSGRLYPSDEHADINDAARKTLIWLRSSDDSPVHWIGREDLSKDDVCDELSTAGIGQALGLDHRDERDLPDVLALLLPYSPIVLWPTSGCATPERSELQRVVAEHWNDLPGAFAAAYREEREGSVSTGQRLGVAQLRSAWHDEAWMKFCRLFELRSVTMPEEIV